MTNMEKFEEIFGIKLDPYKSRFTIFPCEAVHIDFCNKYECRLDNCPALNFWNKEYVDPDEGGKNMTKIRLSETKPGDTVIIAGREYNVLDTDFQGGVFCLAKKIAFYEAFDRGNCNNWATSSLRKSLNEEFRKEIEDEIGAEALIEIERDLISDDGLKNYGTCRDKITLITCDEYRKYRYQIPNKNDWWWTATAYRTPNSSNGKMKSYTASCLAGIVHTDGTLNHYIAYYEHNGVVPGLCILSSLEVEKVEEKIWSQS